MNNITNKNGFLQIKFNNETNYKIKKMRNNLGSLPAQDMDLVTLQTLAHSIVRMERKYKVSTETIAETWLNE